MSEETAISTLEQGNNALAAFLDTVPVPSNEVFDEQVGITGGVPYLIMVQNNSVLVNEPTNARPGNYYIVDNSKRELTQLGEQFDCIILGWRMRAMAYNDKSVISVFNPRDAEFENFKQKADARTKDQYRYLWGPEYLIYLPQLEKVVTLYCSNKTLRRAARETIQNYVKKPCTFKRSFIETDEYKWWGTICTKFLGELPVIEDMSAIMKQVEEFTNPQRIEETAVPEMSNAAPDTSVDGEVR